MMMTRDEIIEHISATRRVMEGSYISQNFKRNAIEDRIHSLYKRGGPDGGYIPRMDESELHNAIGNTENTPVEIADRIIARWGTPGG